MNFSFFKVDFEKDIDQIDAHVLKISFSMPEIFLESMLMSARTKIHAKRELIWLRKSDSIWLQSRISKLIKFMKDTDRYSSISENVRGISSKFWPR